MSSAASRHWSLGARLTAWYCGVFVASAILLIGAASFVTRASVQHQLSARLAVAVDHERADS
jgi:hypothetical protein